jgi:hypothetical protein
MSVTGTAVSRGMDIYPPRLDGLSAGGMRLSGLRGPGLPVRTPEEQVHTEACTDRRRDPHMSYRVGRVW